MSITPSRPYPPFGVAAESEKPLNPSDSDSAHLTLVQETTNALMILDRDGIVRFADRGAENLFGGGQPLIGKPTPIPVRPGEHVVSVSNDADTEAQRFIEVRVADSDWQGAPAYVASASDITARRQIEEAIDNARSASERAGRDNEAFFSSLSHSLRTPLTDIIGFSELMKDERLGPLENDKYKDYVADIHASSLRLLRMIDDALGLATDDDADATDNGATTGDVIRLADNCRRANGEAAFYISAANNIAEQQITGDRDSVLQAFRLLISDAARNAKSECSAVLSAETDNDFVSLEFDKCWFDHSDADLAHMLDSQNEATPDLFALNPAKQRFQKTAAAFAAVKRVTDLYGGTFAILANGDNGVRLRIKLRIAT